MGTRKTRTTPPFARFPGSPDRVPARRPLHDQTPIWFAMSFRACPRGTTVRRAPTRRSGRKEHHCARCTWGARAFIPVALAGAVLFTLPRRPRPPPRRRPRPSRSSRSPEPRWVTRGATAPSARAPSTARGWSSTHTARRATAPRSAARTLRSARSIYLYFKNRGRASRTNPKVGDLVIWGYGTHIGIYIGNGKAVSTLRNGVRIHGVFAVTARFTAYLHTGMSTRPAS